MIVSLDPTLFLSIMVLWVKGLLAAATFFGWLRLIRRETKLTFEGLNIDGPVNVLVTFSAALILIGIVMADRDMMPKTASAIKSTPVMELTVPEFNPEPFETFKDKLDEATEKAREANEKAKEKFLNTK